MNLPRLNGQMVLERLAHDPATRAIPVIVVSATAENVRITAQVRAVFGKPFEVRDLTEVIRGVLTGARVGAAP